MKITFSFLLVACLMASSQMFAQTAPGLTATTPPPAPANISSAPIVRPNGWPAMKDPSSNKSSRVKGIDYAPGGSIRSVYLRDGTFVHLSPELARQTGEFLHKGVRLTATGDVQTFASETTLEAKSITVAGRTFIVPKLPSDPQPAGDTPPPPMRGSRARDPGFQGGPDGRGPAAPPPPSGPQPGKQTAPPPAPDATPQF